MHLDFAWEQLYSSGEGVVGIPETWVKAAETGNGAFDRCGSYNVLDTVIVMFSVVCWCCCHDGYGRIVEKTMLKRR
jgi:hypothetical protein